MIAKRTPAARRLPVVAADRQQFIEGEPPTHSRLPEIAAERVGEGRNDRGAIAAIDIDAVADSAAQSLDEGRTVEMSPTIVRTAAAGAIIGDKARTQRVNGACHQRRRKIARLSASGPTAGVIEHVGPWQLRICRGMRQLIPRRCRHTENNVKSMPRYVEGAPIITRSRTILPMPRHVPNTDAAKRGWRIDQVESNEA